MQNPIIAALLRLIVPLYGLLNLFLISKGLNPIPFSEEEVSTAFSGIVTFIGIVWAWWKNNTVTKKAQEIQLYFEEHKKPPS